MEQKLLWSISGGEEGSGEAGRVLRARLAGRDARGAEFVTALHAGNRIKQSIHLVQFL